MTTDLQREELAEMLRAEDRVWVREVWSIEPDGKQSIRFAEFSLRHPPPTWDEHAWEYRQALFLAKVSSGEQTAEWIDRVQTDTPNDLAWPARFERRRSGETGRSEIVEWPVDEWRSPFAAQRNAVVGELVPGKGPTFRDFNLGVANLLGLIHRPGWSSPSPEFVVRRQDRRARITSVFVARTGIEVKVEGGELAGAALEVAGESPGPSEELDGTSPQRVKFDAPVPAVPWVVLRRDGAVLDSRLQLERPHAGAVGEWGVTWEPEPEPADDSPFTVDEQQAISASIAAIKIQVAVSLPPIQGAEMSAALDDMDRKSSRQGRLEWRKYVYGSLVDLGVRSVVTWPHVDFVFNLLRRGIAQLTGLELPALPQ
jgi:hypothetical protein